MFIETPEGTYMKTIVMQIARYVYKHTKKPQKIVFRHATRLNAQVDKYIENKTFKTTQRKQGNR